MQRRAAIITALRTPVGRHAGALASVRPDDLAAHIIKAVVARSGIDPALIEDVYFGATNQAGEDNRNVARMAALLAGLPASVPGSTVNRLCASGLEAVNIAARMIEASHGDVFIAGGVESMSRAPYVLSKGESAFDRSQQIFDTSIGWRLVNPRMAALHHPFSMGATAEDVARQHKISRVDQDQFALQSQQRWSAAHQRGLFAPEIVPVEIPQRKGAPTLVSVDEHPRPDTTLENLARLKPAFSKDDQGTVTAGNSSGINDGAAALLIVEAGLAKSLGPQPIAFIGPSGRRRSRVQGARPRARDSQGASAGETDARPHRPVRVERGVRRAGPRLPARAGHRQRKIERQRRRDCDRSPAWLQRRPPGHDADPRDGSHRRLARHRVALRRGRARPGDGLRTGG